MLRTAIVRVGVILTSLKVCAIAGAADDLPRIPVQSPDGKNAISLQVVNGQVIFAVERNGRVVIGPSLLNVQLADSGSLAENCSLQSVDFGTIDETTDLHWGKSSQLQDRCAWARFRLRSAQGIAWEIDLRAYDDGVALRYALPEQAALKDVSVAKEQIEFRLAGDPSLLYMTCKDFATSHEANYEKSRLADVSNALLDTPVLVTWPKGPAAAIAEAGLRHSPHLYLRRGEAPEGILLQGEFAPLPSRPGVIAVAKPPYHSPWRAILLSDEAGKLVESNLLLCLNDAPRGDFSWVAPGKTTWQWWNGTAESGLRFKTGMNPETHKHYIDFCAKHGIEYHAVVADDRPWYVQTATGYAPGSDTDILTPRPELRLPEILRYANENGVGIRLWVHWQPLAEKLDEAFATYAGWGVKGLMVDFLDRDDQEMVGFNQRVLDAAARHKLHVQIHGSYPPSGEQRTFPHLMNREAALNLEYLKWSDLCTPPHNVNVAYTRLLAGPVDYHLGGFRSVSRRDFQPRNENPLVLGTRCHHLGLYVVYDNPLPMVSDSPSAYDDQVGFDFLAEVPTTWDETHFVAGEPGEFIVIARRKGDVWYVGGINNWTERMVDLSLPFLTNGGYSATRYVDGSMNEEQPNAIRVERSEGDASRWKVSLAPGGGLAAVFRPIVEPPTETKPKLSDD